MNNQTENSGRISRVQLRRGTPKTRRMRNWRPYNSRGRNSRNKRKDPSDEILINDMPLLSSTNNRSNGSINRSIFSAVPDDCRLIASINISKSPSHYPLWQFYFPQDEFDSTGALVTRVKSFEQHFEEHGHIYDFAEIKKKLWFHLNLILVLNDARFIRSWPTFIHDLNEDPERVLSCAGVALHKLATAVSTKNSEDSSLNISYKSSVASGVISPLIICHKPIVGLISINTNNFDRLVTIRGKIIDIGPVDITCTWIAFKCSLCGAQQAIRQREKMLLNPLHCSNNLCSAKKNFIQIRSSSFTRLESFQTIRVQEVSLSEIGVDFDCIPRYVDVELTGSIVDSLCPGEDVIITGILKTRPQETSTSQSQENNFGVYIRAIGVDNRKYLSSKDVEYSEKDLQVVRTISEEQCLFRLLVQSLSPKIYGRKMVKAGVVLALFADAGSQIYAKGGVHVLLVGDPGVGKSQMLESSINVSPYGVFFCGNTNRGTGSFHIGSSTAFAAGSLDVVDYGLWCIDDIDKISSGQQSIIEIMGQRSMSTANIDTFYTISAESSIIAAANPINGHYDLSKNIHENIRMNPALLSVFDLIFVLLDEPNKRHDNLLTEHIHAIHSGIKKMPTNSTIFPMKLTHNSINSNEEISSNLEDRLKLESTDDADLLPPILMRKYIAYTKKNINPRLSAEAAELLKNFYLEFQQQNTDLIKYKNCMTLRHLDGLIRLTQARARLQLSAEATIAHAQDVISIARYGQVDLNAPEEIGRRSFNGSSSNMSNSTLSQTSQLKKFIKMIETRCNVLGRTVFEFDELKDLAAHGGIMCNVTQLIDSINLQGFLLKRGRTLYEFLND